MRNAIKKAAAAFGLTASVTAGLVGLGTTPAHAAYGCVGFPDWGGIYYHCMTVDYSVLPTVSLAGSTPVGTTVPAICYFVSCTSPTPVGTTVPVAVSTTRPSNDVEVFEFEYACYRYYYGTYCSTYYRIRYDAWANVCYFETNDSTLRTLDGTSVRCTL